jgi:hypothetical protein
MSSRFYIRICPEAELTAIDSARHFYGRTGEAGKSCVRFKRLSDLDEDVLRELIRHSAAASWGM